ncbi:EscU/YscU/HrcU family type III secretion system export apparatus switch protein [Hydrogenophaga sp. SL48]|uniref:EscU/YscU/HrcU family type III secretion system export apparatus switch protein n=1 Tax=Hydrogenophaga sp. SL48 TaxID=2806347 RepID=UPI001F19615D|nr:EscU/YscU/HrcU family type III secretion system export apparatus switch protein [Hydrogenophaga sp. SL48]UJW81330.1 EscU/YscU/HrcU family type III secretion system export apparatus switch protein [Hydrogenophaga sp. SL48]
MSSSAQDKNLPATAQRLKKTREQGQIARSKDLANLSVLGGGAVLLMVLLPTGFGLMLDALNAQLRFDHRALLQPQLMMERLTGGFGHGLMVYLPLGVATIALALGVSFASGSWALSTHPIAPDLTRLSPLAGLGRLFSKQQLVETVKLVFMTAIVGTVGWNFLSSHIQAFSGLLMLPLEGSLGQLGVWMKTGVTLLLVVITLFAVIDFPVQKFLHANRLKMSMEEVKREHKESEGDPQMKGQRRRRQRELAQRISVGAVPRADLVVMNPTHYAVAIRYDDATMNAPRVIAKGADLIALKIRDVAKEHKIPVLQSPMLARALYAHAEIDHEIPSALYTAVAQVLAYVYQLKAAMAGRGAMPGDVPTPEVPPELDPHWKPARGAI